MVVQGLVVAQVRVVVQVPLAVQVPVSCCRPCRPATPVAQGRSGACEKNWPVEQVTRTGSGNDLASRTVP